MSTVIVTALLIIGSAFFVMVEFSLMAARRYRLEESARTSRAGRAALRNASDLTLMLAGAQLGITLCTLALGAFTKPAVHHALTPLIERWGLSPDLANAASFVLALLLVTFLHLVVGEMAPKSLSLAHPERVAVWLALPMRGFLWATRPVLRLLNSAANWLVRRSGAEPVDEVGSTQDAASLRHLVEHSASVGALATTYHRGVVGALEMSSTSLASIATPEERVAAVGPHATVADVQAATTSSGHLRILVRGDDRVLGVVHVRDTMGERPDAPIVPHLRRVLVLDGRSTAHAALARMRKTRTHVAVVVDRGRRVGIVTLDDVLPRVLPKERPARG
jgi:CBS domain containing-hemolysin-like protein